MKIKNKDKKKILEFHNLVVKGLVNGLTHTNRDGRNEDIEWVRKRLMLWESFGRTVFDFIIGLNDYSYSLKDLERVAKEGYSHKSSKGKSQ
ncbi:hypothetical protein LCGC14_0465660 [marine sediment metagenome]|uniref:Uncharacterized protein n=1 Tax=marine sediment metagenome TaxID=412755 RepID=A0A0F9SWJ7_9ZZZZ